MKLLSVVPSLLLLLATQAVAQLAVEVSPSAYYAIDTAPYGHFTITNTGLETVDIVVINEPGVLSADSVGSTIITTEEIAPMGDLSGHLVYFPDRMTLQGGGKQVVRFMVKDTVPQTPSRGHVAIFRFRLNERSAVLPEETPEVGAVLSVVYELVAPIVFIQGEGQPSLQASVLAQTNQTLTLLLTNSSPFPFIGEVSIWNGDEHLGATKIAVYNRRAAPIPLSTPVTADSLSLRFSTTALGTNTDKILHRFIPPSDITIGLRDD